MSEEFLDIKYELLQQHQRCSIDCHEVDGPNEKCMSECNSIRDLELAVEKTYAPKDARIKELETLLQNIFLMLNPDCANCGWRSLRTGECVAQGEEIQCDDAKARALIQAALKEGK